MNKQQLIEALAIIADERTEPVEIRIGGELYLIQCRSSVIDNLLDQGYSVEATKYDGVHVMYPNPETY